MKKLTLFVALCVGASSFSYAKGTYPMAGCGPWYLIFGHKDNSQSTQIGIWLLTNLVFPGGAGLTSSMTSGTSGCTESGELRWVRSAEVFAQANFDTLKTEIATGEGEYVSTFTSLLGVSAEQSTEFVGLMKENFTTLVPNESATHLDLMRNVTVLLNTYQTPVS